VSLQMDRPVALLVTAEILRLNKEHLETLAKNDPVNRPPTGFWAWQAVAAAIWEAAGSIGSENRQRSDDDFCGPFN